MRIGIVCPYSWDIPGGVQAHVRDLAEQLIELRAQPGCAGDAIVGAEPQPAATARGRQFDHDLGLAG